MGHVSIEMAFEVHHSMINMLIRNEQMIANINLLYVKPYETIHKYQMNE